MSLPIRETNDSSLLDLRHPAPLSEFAAKSRKEVLPAGRMRAVRILAAEDDPRLRVHGLCEVYRKLDTREIADHLATAGKLALYDDPAGLRFLFSFLEVKRPGVEVMRQIEKLASLERIGLRIVSGSWTDPSEAVEPSAGRITEVLKQASRIGAFNGAADPGTALSYREIVGELRAWFTRSGAVLDSGRRLPGPMMEAVTEVAKLEIALLERRLSRIASRIDPYDTRGISRLMPVVSFYDQDIEHLKNVVARLETYRPFHERLLTMEQNITTREMDGVVHDLDGRPEGGPVAEMIRSMRERPLLDREFAYLAAAVHQVAATRAAALGIEAPDILSILLGVIRHATTSGTIEVALEDDLLDDAGCPVSDLIRHGLAERTPSGLLIAHREDRAAELVQPDGLPRLSAAIEDRKERVLSIKDLVFSQMGNEPFILGLLENTRVTGHPGVIPTIVMNSRSLRVLTKIATIRGLHTGPANKDVPRLLLQSAVRVPVNTLKPLIHVRFVSRVDLDRLFRSGNELRSEVRKEIKNYLDHLKK